MKSVLFILSRPLDPTDNGRKVRLKQVIRVSVEMGLSVDIAYILTSKESALNSCPSGVRKFIILKANKRLRLFARLGMGFVLGRPLQVSLYLNRTNLRRLQHLIDEFKYDRLYFDMLRTGWYLRFLRVPKNGTAIVDLDDLLSKRYASETGYNHATAIGFFNSGIQASVYRVLGGLVTAYESKSMRRYEKLIARLPCKVALVSDQERKALAKRVPAYFRDNIMHLPLTGSFDEASPRQFVEQPSDRIGFIGNLSLKSNYDGLVNFLRSNHEFLSDQHVRIEVIGRAPDGVVKTLTQLSATLNISVRVYGYVKDLKTATQSWLLAVAPNTYGTGTNTKILDYLALGLLIIADKYALRGLEEVCSTVAFDLDSRSFADTYLRIKQMRPSDRERHSSVQASIYNDRYSRTVLRKRLETLLC